MICRNAREVTRNGYRLLCLDVLVPEEEVYQGAEPTLANVGKLLRGEAFPRKQFQVPPVPFFVSIPGDPRTVIVEAVDGCEGDFPGKLLALYSRSLSGDCDWLVGQVIEFRPVGEKRSVLETSGPGRDCQTAHRCAEAQPDAVEPAHGTIE